MGLSFSHIVVVAIVVLLLFGSRKIPELMGDLATGLKTFKRALNEPDDVAVS